MRHNKSGASDHQLVERVLQRTFSAIVQGARRLVEDEDRRIPQDCARDRYALFLTAGESVAALADHGVVPVVETGNELVDLRDARCLLDLGVRGVGFREPKVLTNRRVEEIRLLRHHTYQVGDRRQIEVPQIDVVDSHRSRSRVVQTCGQVSESGLARTRGADKRQGSAGRDREVDVVEGLAVGSWIREVDVVEPKFAGHLGAVEALRLFRIRDVDRQIQVLEHATEQCHRALHLDARVEQHHGGAEQLCLQRGECDEGADGDGVAVIESETGKPVDQCRHGCEGDRHGRHAPLAGHHGSEFDVCDFR